MHATVVGLMATMAFAGPAAAQWSPDTAAALFARSQQKGADQLANPAYAQLAAPHLADNAAGTDADRSASVDPFRLTWGEERGIEHDVRIPNRYGVEMFGHLSVPRGARRHPAIVLLNGGWGTEGAYRSWAQSLAEAGYVVLGLDVQGDGRTAAEPADPAFCRPGSWQEPQEMGLQEKGTCAGVPPEDGALRAPLVGVGPGEAQLIASSLDDNAPDQELLQGPYDAQAPRKVFGALDAVAWLRSDANPVRDRVRASRIGIGGHSLGAYGALLAGNGDPQQRISAVVTFDGFGRLPEAIAPSIPTMFQHSDLNDFGPHRTAPDPEVLPGFQDASRFRAAGVDVMAVSLAATGHQDFNYVPYVSNNPFCPACGASRDGERVSIYYARAWFDRYLRRGTPRRRGTRRLLARELDASVDSSSIGQGPYDAATGRNVPPRIAGMPVGEALSPLFRQMAHFGDVACDDVRAGC